MSMVFLDFPIGLADSAVAHSALPSPLFVIRREPHAHCPGLTRLRSEAAAAAGRMTGIAASDRREAYTRFPAVSCRSVRHGTEHCEQCETFDVCKRQQENCVRETL